jgi:hypothetical protein
MAALLQYAQIPLAIKVGGISNQLKVRRINQSGL